MRTGGRRVEHHLVDEFGLVGCPRQKRDVSWDECLTCPYLIGVEPGDGQQVAEIRCSAGARMTARSPWEVFGPVWPMR
ncbi:MAG: hypothetical protein ACLFRD_01795 [Nitriliruptoraceae bacterium]